MLGVILRRKFRLPSSGWTRKLQYLPKRWIVLKTWRGSSSKAGLARSFRSCYRNVPATVRVQARRGVPSRYRVPTPFCHFLKSSHGRKRKRVTRCTWPRTTYLGGTCFKSQQFSLTLFPIIIVKIVFLDFVLRQGYKLMQLCFGSYILFPLSGKKGGPDTGLRLAQQGFQRMGFLSSRFFNLKTEVEFSFRNAILLFYYSDDGQCPKEQFYAV